MSASKTFSCPWNLVNARQGAFSAIESLSEKIEPSIRKEGKTNGQIRDIFCSDISFALHVTSVEEVRPV